MHETQVVANNNPGDFFRAVATSADQVGTYPEAFGSDNSEIYYLRVDKLPAEFTNTQAGVSN